MKRILPLLILGLLSFSSYSICPAGYSEYIIQIIPDSRPNDISWKLTNEAGIVVAQGLSAGDTLCLSDDSTFIFTIDDSFRDGIDTPGGFWIYQNTDTICNNPNYDSYFQQVINGQPGSYCPNALPLTPGSHVANLDDTWYEFFVTQSGIYRFTTCNLDSCDTKIWLYNGCPKIPYPENLQGTFSFNDDNCGVQAELNVYLQAGTTYFLRMGDNFNGCPNPIAFQFSYEGPVTGCTDILACNYNPQATVSDSSCLYAPNPGCAGPDLQIDSTVLVTSLGLLARNATNCDVVEGCVTGYGTRTVLGFTSRINNIGTLDFYIGNELTQPGMFNTLNCHGHDHYEGYGDYRLYDMSGNQLPAGHKNGYCVIDLCGSIHNYTCSNMGISANCYDAYGFGTQCQWIDITDVPDGDYRLAVIINSRHYPDALGRFETNYTNNAVQICLNFSTDSIGNRHYALLPACSPYVDCMGIPAGTAMPDCNGICNGLSVFGDVYNDGTLDNLDVYTYLDILESTLPAVVCNDLNGDGQLSIHDAALANWCVHTTPAQPGAHNHCQFPKNIYNPNELTGLLISQVDFANGFLDVNLLNSASNVKAFQFTISGVEISSVVSLLDPVAFPADFRFRGSTHEVFGLSLVDSNIVRSVNQQPLVRIYFSDITDTVICINSIREIVNQNGERTNANIFGNCFAAIPTDIQSPIASAELIMIPNPAQQQAYVHVNAKSISGLQIFDAAGRSFKVSGTFLREGWYNLDLSGLPSGLYMLRMQGAEAYGTLRFVKL